MVIILPRHKTAAENIGGSFRKGLEKGLDEEMQEEMEIRKEQRKNLIEDLRLKKKRDFEELENEKLSKFMESEYGVDTKGLPKEFQEAILKEEAKGKAKRRNLESFGFGDLIKGNQSQDREIPQEQPSKFGPRSGEMEVGDVNVPTLIPENKIYAAEAAGEHGLAQQMRAHNQEIEKQVRHQELVGAKNASIDQKKFEADRAYHTQFSKKAEEEAEGIRSSLSRKQNSLNFARDAIESSDMSYFSPDKLADATGIDLFRTAKGAQLVTAGKENLLSNMSRVSARAQNQWFEQRLNSMFAKIGQSKEANLTVQEMLEGEVAIDSLYLKEFDKIAERDMEDYGYVKKDISKRAHDAIKPLEKEIMKRSSYRMKEIEEKEKGLSSMKKQVGKNVSKGTPFTLAMAKLYIEKFGDKALDVAEKNGYSVPTYEEFGTYQERPQQFRESL